MRPPSRFISGLALGPRISLPASVGNGRHTSSRRTPSIRLSHPISLLALPLGELISRRSAARSPHPLHMHDDMPRYFYWSDTSSRQIYKNRNTKCLVSVFIRYARCKHENGHNPCPSIPSFLLFSFDLHSTHYHLELILSLNTYSTDNNVWPITPTCT